MSVTAAHRRLRGAERGARFLRRAIVDSTQIVRQVIRLVVAAPGTGTGRYPAGNTGGANVSALEPMPIPDDLRAVLGGSVIAPDRHDTERR